MRAPLYIMFVWRDGRTSPPCSFADRQFDAAPEVSLGVLDSRPTRIRVASAVRFKRCGTISENFLIYEEIGDLDAED